MNCDCLKKYSDWGPLFLRLVAGIIFVFAGIDKFLTTPGKTEMFTMLGIPAAGAAVLVLGVIEIVGGIMILIGWQARLAAIPLAIAMLVAFVVMFKANGFAMPTWTAFYALGITLYLAVSGSGPMSVDK